MIITHIHQRGYLSSQFSTYKIQLAEIVLSIPSSSIVFTDNNPNWENASTTNPTSYSKILYYFFTYSQLKP